MKTYRVRPKKVSGAAVRPPGSKSITNRALAAAALADGTSVLRNPLRSDDTEAMTECLRAMGVEVTEQGEDAAVRGTARLRGGGRLPARASGTTARFITALAVLADGPGVIDGTARLRRRPIGPLVETLAALGGRLERTEYPPVHVRGGGLPGGSAPIDGSLSSQFLTAVMLAAPRAGADVTLRPGPVMVSRPYVTTTLEVMAAFGAQAGWNGDGSLTVRAAGYRPCDYRVEADASAAVYPWTAAAVTGGRATVVGISPDTAQADAAALEVLERMGCRVERSPEGITVSGPERLRGATADLNHCPDAALALAAAAATASGPSRFVNLANLRIKETDRLAALETELRKLGAEAQAGPDWIAVRPGKLRGARLRTYDDHRMAMSLAVVGLAVPGVVIEDPDCVGKTWPGFFEMLERL